MYYLQKFNNISIIIRTYEATQQSILTHNTVTHHKNFIYPILHNTTPPHIKWIPRGQLYHIYPRWTLGTSQPQYEMFNYSLWFFNNLDLNILVPYDAQLQHKPSYLLWIYQKVLDNVILMTFYKFELSQVAISVLNISTCILCITTLLFAKPRDGLLIRLKLRAVGSKRK